MVESSIPLAAASSWLDPSVNELTVALLLLIATALYLAYHLAISPPIVARLFPRRAGELELRTAIAFFRKLLGAVLLGLVPAIAIASSWPGGLPACGVSLDNAGRSLALGLGFAALMLPLLALQARKPSFRLHYPEVRIPLTHSVAINNALAWGVYLIAYEFFFRGVLVLGLAPFVGALPALAISLMGYVFVHLGRYAGETIGTLFSGALFGVVALDTGSILMPIVAHIGVALSADHLAARAAGRAAHG